MRDASQSIAASRVAQQLNIGRKFIYKAIGKMGVEQGMNDVLVLYLMWSYLHGRGCLTTELSNYTLGRQPIGLFY